MHLICNINILLLGIFDVLSTQAIKNTSQASHYFLGQDNYYTHDSTGPQENNQWWGKGTALLGLSGAIDTQQFTELLLPFSLFLSSAPGT